MTGKSDQVKGKAKQVTGIVTGNKDLEGEGNTDRLSGETAEKIDHAQGKVHDAIENVEGFIGGAFDKAKGAVDQVLDKAKELIH